MPDVTFIQSRKSSNRGSRTCEKTDFNTSNLSELARDALDMPPNQEFNLYLSHGGSYKDGKIPEDGEIYVKFKSQQIENDILHLCVLGPGAVGKSALTLRFTNDSFSDDYDPTIEDAYRKNIKVDGENILLDILDTAGQEEFTALRASWYRNKDGFLLVFAVDKKRSLLVLDEFFHQQLVEFYDEPEKVPPLILLGNKCDLPENQKEVDMSMGLENADKYEAVAYMETSALSGKNVTKAFAKLVRACLERRLQPDDSNAGGSDMCCSVQ